MSVRTMARVWAESKQSGTHLLMLLAIADFADDDGNAYPSVPTLAEKCRMQTRNANVILAALKTSGELQVRPNEGPKGTNRYRIVMPSQGVQSLAVVGLQANAGVQERAGVQRLASPPAKACSKPLQRIADEPSLNHHEPPTLCDGVVESFDSFWSAYPRKVNKPAARKAFTKLKPDAALMAAILSAIGMQRRSEQWAKDQGRFIPHPATWLRGERWKDDMGEAGATTQQGTKSPAGAANDLLSNPTPQWATSAGFRNRFEAENAGCSERNHKQFAKGQRVAA